MLSSKEKKYLKALASTADAIVQVGKFGVNDSVLHALEEALVARELVKVKVLQNCGEDVALVGMRLAQASGSELVQKIGRVILLYRAHPEKPKIVLPQ